MKQGAMDVTPELLRQELGQLPKETLVDLVDLWMQMYWVCQSHWVSYVERDFGVDNATRLDGEVFSKSSKIQGRKLKKVYGLGDDMQALAFLMRHSVLQWAPAGFEWSFTEIAEDHIDLEVRTCPMGTYRKGHGLEVYPCRNFALPLYIELAKTINPNITATCIHAHPDPEVEGLMCRWRFYYETQPEA